MTEVAADALSVPLDASLSSNLVATAVVFEGVFLGVFLGGTVTLIAFVATAATDLVLGFGLELLSRSCWTAAAGAALADISGPRLLSPDESRSAFSLLQRHARALLPSRTVTPFSCRMMTSCFTITARFAFFTGFREEP